MIHYESKETEIIKYEVVIDTERLKQIRQTVFNQCTEVTVVCCKGTKEPTALPGQTIIDLTKKFLYVENHLPVYRYEYFSHQEPRLIYLIDQLLEGNAMVLSELSSPNEPISKKDQIEQAISYFLPIHYSTNFDLLIACLQEYKEYVFLNSNRLSSKEEINPIDYYPKVLECVQMKELERIPVQNLEKVMAFFQEELATVLEELQEIKQNSEEDSNGVQKKVGSLKEN